ncbi:hypothetical protein D3C72_1998200 [compost metagenome]
MVAMPISINRPISAGSESMFWVISNAPNAPPAHNGTAARMVTGISAWLNSSNSTM